MKKATSCLVLLLAISLPTKVLAESAIDLAVGSEYLAVDYRIKDLKRGHQWGVGGVYNDDKSATAVSAGFSVVGDAIESGEIETGLGLKGIIHDTFETAGSLALVGTVRFAPLNFYRLGMEGRAFFAPELLNVRSAKQYLELVARVTYAAHPQADVFLGWTEVNVEYDDAVIDDVDVQSGVNVGFTLRF